VEEFEQTFRELGHVLSREELHEFVRELDEDGSGTIELEEFANFLKKYSD
jgi:Ca2+-binding EF-hand superfamily protein